MGSAVLLGEGLDILSRGFFLSLRPGHILEFDTVDVTERLLSAQIPVALPYTIEDQV